MTKSLTGQKIAILMANGFDESHFFLAQKLMQEMGGTMRIISTNQGLVNGWDGSGWGHNYAVDAPLNTALGVDYDALIVPGGLRSLDKLKVTAHTRRFIGSFMAANKPVAVMNDALTLMAHTEQLDGRRVSGDENCRDIAAQADASWDDGGVAVDNNMISGLCDGEHAQAYREQMRDLFATIPSQDMDQAA